MAEPDVLFYERGASWAWLLAGPLAGTGMAVLQWTGDYGHDLWVPLIFLIVVSGFVSVQIKAARIHTSVELTRETLREGAETIQLDEIIAIYPPAESSDEQKWQLSRALGELSGIPKGRTGIGLKLTGGRRAQAWARKHRKLREVLTSLINERTP